MANQNDIRQAITDQIISALESGNVPPWRRPWRLGKNAGAPANVVSKRSYRGLNPILLALHAEKHQLSSKWYGTFNQWKALGGRVMRRPENVPQGQWGCQICFWTPVTKTVHTEEGDEEEDRFFVLRLYTVFCVDQVEGKNLDHLRAGQADLVSPSPSITSPPRMPSRQPEQVSDTAGVRRSTALPGTTSRFRPRRPLRAWTSSMAPPSTNCATGASTRPA